MNSKSFSRLVALTSFLLLVLVADSYGQQPVVTSVANASSMGDVFSIKGNNFGTDKTKLTVFFGGVKATILSATDQLLEVVTPNAATYDNVSVTRAQITDPGLTGYARDQFLLSFGGSDPFDVNNLDVQQDFSAEKGLYDICACDFDGDGDLDLATANKESTNLSILFNSSTPGTIKFNAADFKLIAIGGKSLQIKCGDLNGDGRPDIIASEGDVGNRLFILQNTGGGNFTQQAMAMPLVGVLQIKIADLDRDGKPDLVISHADDSMVGKIWVLKNQTTSSTVAFAAPVALAVLQGTTSNNALTTDALDVIDLNRDGYPEIITSQRLIAKSGIFIMANKSTPGTISFGATTYLDVRQGIVNIKAGDMDGDDNPDIIVAQLSSASVSVLVNQSSGSSFVFSAPKSVTTETSPYGIGVGDLDGDSKPDLIVGSIVGNLAILNNTSTPGVISFVKSTKITSTKNRHLAIGDLDGDGKPDIAFTTIDDVSKLNQKVSVFRNKTCMIPKITPAPASTIKICTGASLVLKSTISNGATYTWSNGTNATTLTVPNAAPSSNVFSVIVSPQAGGIVCPTSSNTVAVDVANGSAAVPVFDSPNGPVCLGNPLAVNVSNAQVNRTYKWRGPENFTYTGNPAKLTNFQVNNAGRYVVDVVDNVGGCIAQQASIVVDAIDAQSFTVLFAGSSVLCAGDPKKILSINPSSPTYTYKWFNKTAELTGHVSDTLRVSSTGEYSAEITTSTCGTPKTTTAKITVATVPVVNFTTDPATTACQGQNIHFTNTSTGVSPDLIPTYEWDFNDLTPHSNDENPIHKYESSGTPSPKLTISYASACSNSKASPLTIQPAPVVKITNPDASGVFEFCDGENIKLQVPGAFVSYTWSTGESSPSIVVTQPGTYTVEVKTASCTLNAEQLVITNKTAVMISADPVEIEEGKSSQFNATGLLNYEWSPADGLSNAAIENPMASPLVTTTYSVTGKDDKGCTGQATFQLLVKGEPAVNKLKPANFFSPNKDGNNDAWKVDNIKNYPQCGVAVYDDKGIKVFEAKPYTEDWEGTMKGKRLPDGVYYFIIRCDGEEAKPRSGSITLLR